MENPTILIALIVIVLFVLVVCVRSAANLDKWRLLEGRADTTSIAFLVIILNNVPEFFQTSREAHELFVEGASSSNLYTVLIGMITLLISSYLILSRFYVRHNILCGPSFWLIGLCALYLASTMWSLWPLGTAFRSVELISYYIIAICIFSGKDPLGLLYRLLALQMALGAINLAPEGIEALAKGRYISFMLSNQYSFYAAAFLLLNHHLRGPSIPGRFRVPGYVYGLSLLLAFGSTATLAALCVGSATYYLYGQTKSLLYIFRAPIVVSLITFCVSFMFFPEYFSGIIDFLSVALQKKTELFYNADGRLLVWNIYFDSFKDKPLGAGFWAERVFLDSFSSAGWIPKSGHNGFLCAWIGAGLPAVLCLTAVYVSLFKRLQNQSKPVRRICYALSVMLFVNSMTFPGIGGYFTMWYYVLAAVIMLAGSNERSAVSIRNQRAYNFGPLEYPLIHH